MKITLTYTITAILGILFGIVLSIATPALGEIISSKSDVETNSTSPSKTADPVHDPKAFVEVDATSTTTAQVAKNQMYYIDSEFKEQGVCLKIKDSDGSGFTYLTVSNGTGTFSTTSCE